jgi:ankyrin repeat protein
LGEAEGRGQRTNRRAGGEDRGVLRSELQREDEPRRTAAGGVAGDRGLQLRRRGAARRRRSRPQRAAKRSEPRDPRTGWTALHAACASRWHHSEPARAAGLAAVARTLIDAGADPLEPRRSASARSSGWTPLRCVIASANSGPSNRLVVELLVANGAQPNDHDLYLAGAELLPLLLARLRDPAELRQAFAAPISNDDADAVRLLLEAGADPRRYLDDDGQAVPAVWAATKAGCGAGLVELLLEHGADPNLAGPDGRTPYQLATAAGRTDLLDRLNTAERAALVRAGETGNTAAVALMLDLGSPLETRAANGATALHAAAYTGSAETVRLLLDRGADLEARDTTWNSTPLDWAAVGSGERPTTAPEPDWATDRTRPPRARRDNRRNHPRTR